MKYSTLLIFSYLANVLCAAATSAQNNNNNTGTGVAGPTQSVTGNQNNKPPVPLRDSSMIPQLRNLPTLIPVPQPPAGLQNLPVQVSPGPTKQSQTTGQTGQQTGQTQPTTAAPNASAVPQPAAPIPDVLKGSVQGFGILQASRQWTYGDSDLMDEYIPQDVLNTLNPQLQTTGVVLGLKDLFTTGDSHENVLWNSLLQYYCLLSDAARFYHTGESGDRDRLCDPQFKAVLAATERVLADYLPIFGDNSTLADNAFSWALRTLSNFGEKENDVFIRGGLSPQVLHDTIADITSTALGFTPIAHLNISGVQQQAPSALYPEIPVIDSNSSTTYQNELASLVLSRNMPFLQIALSKLTANEFNSLDDTQKAHLVNVIVFAHRLIDENSDAPMTAADLAFDISNSSTRAEKYFTNLKNLGKAYPQDMQDGVDHVKVLTSMGVPLGQPAQPQTNQPTQQPASPQAPATNAPTPADGVKKVEKSESEGWSTTMWIVISVLGLAALCLVVAAVWYFTKNKE